MATIYHTNSSSFSWIILTNESPACRSYRLSSQSCLLTLLEQLQSALLLLVVRFHHLRHCPRLRKHQSLVSFVLVISRYSTLGWRTLYTLGKVPSSRFKRSNNPEVVRWTCAHKVSAYKATMDLYSLGTFLTCPLPKVDRFFFPLQVFKPRY